MEEFWKTADNDIINYVKQEEKHELLVNSINCFKDFVIISLLLYIVNKVYYDCSLEKGIIYAYIVEESVFAIVLLIGEIETYIKYKKATNPVELLSAHAKCIGKEKVFIWSQWIYRREYNINLELPDRNVIEKYSVSKEMYDNVEYGHNLLIVKDVESDKEIDKIYINPSKFKY